MNKNELSAALAQFTGTEGYHRLTYATKVLFTDGAHFLAENAGAYWLMDVIASHLPSMPKDEGFVIAHLRTYMGESGRSAYFTLSRDLDEDEPIDVYAQQAIEYTDFPLDAITLYAAFDGSRWVVTLTSEY